MNDLIASNRILDDDEMYELILSETDPAEMDKIVSLFNAYSQKKELIRALKLNKMQDKVLNQMDSNLNLSVEMSDKTLVDYYRTLSDAGSKAVAKPTANAAVQVNQINVGNDEQISRESRERILAAINQFIYPINSTEETQND